MLLTRKKCKDIVIRGVGLDVRICETDGTLLILAASKRCREIGIYCGAGFYGCRFLPALTV